MSILKVARLGHPVLRVKTRPVAPAEIKSPRIQQLIDDLFETMNEYQGIGLAAPQVHESVRLFVAGIERGVPENDHPEGPATAGPDRLEKDDLLAPMALFNPEITPTGTRVVEDWEGCLSIPDLRGKVPRAHEIAVRGLDRKARRVDLTLRGFPARVIQHETDHLDGVLFLDRMRSFETLTFMEEFGRYWVDD